MRPSFSTRALVALLWLLGVLPGRISVAICRFLAWLWYLLDRKHRRKMLLDMRRTPLAARSDCELASLVRKVYLHFGTNLAEVAKFRVWPAERVDACIDFSEGPPLSAAVKEGKGLLLITAHLGNWELAGMAAPLKGVPLSAVARPLKDSAMDALLTGIRTRFGQRIMTKFNVMLEIIRNLKEGRSVGVLIDQDAEHDCVFVPFLGELAGTLTVPAKLAVRYKVPVFCLVSHRVGHFKHRYRVIGPIEYPTTGDDAVEKTAHAFNDVLSQVILEHPEQWMWFHHRWREADKQGLTRLAKGGTQ